MQKTKKKQKWVKPMLTVLVRGDSQDEMVLATCKGRATWCGNGVVYRSCYYATTGVQCNALCVDLSSS